MWIVHSLWIVFLETSRCFDLSTRSLGHETNSSRWEVETLWSFKKHYPKWVNNNIINISIYWILDPITLFPIVFCCFHIIDMHSDMCLATPISCMLTVSDDSDWICCLHHQRPTHYAGIPTADAFKVVSASHFNLFKISSIISTTIGPFYRVSIPMEVTFPTGGKCVTCHGLHILEDNSEINHSCVSPGIGLFGVYITKT